MGRDDDDQNIGPYLHHHHWLDSPVWALAFFRSFRQSSLSIAAISS
jgi:hypothetical protein